MAELNDILDGLEMGTLEGVQQAIKEMGCYATQIAIEKKENRNQQRRAEEMAEQQQQYLAYEHPARSIQPAINMLKVLGMFREKAAAYFNTVQLYSKLDKNYQKILDTATDIVSNLIDARQDLSEKQKV